MKNLFLFLSFLSFFICNAQEVFYEGDFKTGLKPAYGISITNHFRENNQLIIKSLKGFSLQFHKLDISGNVEDINIDTGLDVAGTDSGNTIGLVAYRNFIEINSNDTIYKISKKNRDKLKNKYFKTNNFNDNFILGLENQKSKEDIDIVKDNMFLLVYDFKKNALKRIEMEKLNVQRLQSNTEKAGFSIVKVTNEYFVLVSKLISKDYKNCSIFFTRYNYDGKIVSDNEVVVNAGNYFFLSSNNGAGEYDFKGTSPIGKDIYHFDNEMFINDVYYDLATNDFYVYGLYGSKASKFNNKISTTGFYICKYDANGLLIWEKFNKLDSTDSSLSQSFYPVLIDTYISSIGNNLCFFARADRLKHFIFFSVFDKETGDVTIQKGMDQDDKWKVKYFTVQFLAGGSKLKDFDDKLFDASTIATMYSDKRILNYINSVQSKKDVMFNTWNLKDYQVLIESDNNTYFKFIKFNKL